MKKTTQPTIRAFLVRFGLSNEEEPIVKRGRATEVASTIAVSWREGTMRKVRWEEDLGKHQCLQEVVQWGLDQEPRVIVEEVVQQDEYTLDVLVPYEDTWLVYDAN